MSLNRMTALMLSMIRSERGVRYGEQKDDCE